MGRSSFGPVQGAHASNREVQYGKRDFRQGARRARRIGTGQTALSVLLQSYRAHHVSSVTLCATRYYCFWLRFTVRACCALVYYALARGCGVIVGMVSLETAHVMLV